MNLIKIGDRVINLDNVTHIEQALVADWDSVDKLGNPAHVQGILVHFNYAAHDLPDYPNREAFVGTEAAMFWRWLEATVTDIWAEANDILREAVKDELRRRTARQEVLVREQRGIESRLAQREAAPEIAELIRSRIQHVRDRLENADYTFKRHILDLMDVHTQVMHDKGKRFLYVTCGDPADPFLSTILPL